jgi:hypothetical protein
METFNGINYNPNKFMLALLSALVYCQVIAVFTASMYNERNIS